MLEKNENIITDNNVEATTAQNGTVTKKRTFMVIIILIVIAMLLGIGTYFSIKRYQKNGPNTAIEEVKSKQYQEDEQNSVIEAVKASNLGGYSKTVEEAFNECFGEENLKWSYDDKKVTVRIEKFNNIPVEELVAENKNFTMIDLGNNVKSDYRYVYITGWTIEFEYNQETKEVSDVILSLGFIKFSKDDTCDSVVYRSLLNAKDDSFEKMLLHGIFKENLDIYKESMKKAEENGLKRQAWKNKTEDLLDKLESNNVDESVINEALDFLVEEGLLTENEAKNFPLDDIKKLLQAYLDAQNSRSPEKEENVDETVARLAAESPYSTEY